MVQEFDITKHYKRFNGHGNGVILKGRVRSGKTTLVGILTYILMQTDFYIITNVRFEDWVFHRYGGRIFYITNDIEYLKAYVQIPEGGRSILFFDDAQANPGMTSKGVMTKQGHQLSTFLIFIGKLETNYMYIAHQRYLPAPLVEGFNPIMLYTLEIGSFYVSDKIFAEERHIEKYGYKINVPDPSEYGLPIVSRAIAKFDFKLNWEELTEFMARYEVGDNLKPAIEEYLGIVTEHEKYNQPHKGPVEQLKRFTYEQILMALSLKRGRIISSGETVADLFNNNTQQKVRDQLKELGYKSVKKKIDIKVPALDEKL